MTNEHIDNRDCVAPAEVALGFCEKTMPAKANLGAAKMFALAIAAGAFVAYGGQGCLTVTTGVPFGLAKFLGGMVFATGLMMVVLTGAELFSGNVLMLFSVIEKKISWTQLFRNWSIVYLGNFVGSMLLAAFVFYGTLSHSAQDALGVNTLMTAYSKVNLSFTEAVCRGILCNGLVCLAVWMATSSKRVIGKIFAIFFPITTFVASGYEHSIANMFLIPSGIFMKSLPHVVTLSGLTNEQLSTLSWNSFFIQNLVPVTIGNIIGAVIFVVLLFWFAYLREDCDKS